MDWIHERLTSFGAQSAIHEGTEVWSYKQLLDHSIRLRKDLSPGQIREIKTRSIAEGIAMLIAIAESSSIAMPLPSNASEGELEEMRSTIIHSPLYHQLDRSGLILFSSGTSGQPKAMLHSLPALLNRFKHVRPRSDRTLQLLLIDHIGGLDAAFRCLFSGSTLIIPEARTPEAAGQAIQDHKVNILPASPTFLNLMLMNGTTEHYDCSSVEIIAYGAEAMPKPLLHRLGSAFPQADLQQKFGTSETGAVRIQSNASNSLFFRITDPDTEWKIIDEELWLKTPSRIIGYINADESSLEADGWYRTGDIVEEGRDQSIRIIGRASATINVGGQKVHPSEVETVLSEIPEIDACRVFGETDRIMGEHVACEIIRTDKEDSRIWKRKIRNHCREKLAPWKIPATVNLIDKLAVNSRLKRS